MATENESRQELVGELLRSEPDLATLAALCIAAPHSQAAPEAEAKIAVARARSILAEIEKSNEIPDPQAMRSSSLGSSMLQRALAEANGKLENQRAIEATLLRQLDTEAGARKKAEGALELVSKELAELKASIEADDSDRPIPPKKK
jgi:hypothetical protein